MPKTTLSEKIMRHVEAGEYDAARELVAPNARVLIGDQSFDREAWLEMGKMFMKAFPDGKHEFEEVIEAGDKVVCRVTFRGTHTGPFQGAPPTGKKGALPAIFIDRIVDGRLVEHRGEFDPTVLMRQLGLMPAA